MAQFVFLPNEGADPASALVSLANAESGSVMFHAASAGGAGPRRSRKSPVRIIDRFEPTGAALVEVAKPADANVAGGTLHPVVTYQMAIAEPRVGRLRLGAAWDPPEPIISGCACARPPMAAPSSAPWFSCV